MSEKLSSSCPICGGYLFSDDDIVYCPQCGAPHHRDCWKTVGHCGLESDHGTDRQYTVPKSQQTESKKSQKAEARHCKYCKKQLEHNSNFCPYCGKIQPPERVNTSNDDEYPDIQFAAFSLGGTNIPKPDPYGGLDKNSEIDGVSIKDIAKFITFAPNKLLPKFKLFQDGKKRFSWNWMAFISPYSHTLFRKMDYQTLMYILLEITACVLVSPLYYSLMYMNMPIGSTAFHIFNKFLENPLQYTSIESIVLAVIGILLFFAYRVYAGFCNDPMYKKHAISTIKKIRADIDSNDEYELHRKGGVRPLLSLLLFMFVFYFGNYALAFIAGFLFG